MLREYVKTSDTVRAILGISIVWRKRCEKECIWRRCCHRERVMGYVIVYLMCLLNSETFLRNLTLADYFDQMSFPNL